MRDPVEKFLRPELPYNYRTFNGKILPNCQVDSYNAVQRNINGFIRENRPIPEYLIDGSHNLFISFCEV